MSSTVEPTSAIAATEVEQVALSPEDTANSITVDSGSLPKEQEETQEREEEKDEHKDQQQTKTTAIAPRADLAAELTFVQERLETIAKEERTGADGEKVALEEIDSDAKEHQWSATKEVYHREFGAITEDATIAPLTEGKAKAAQDIKQLQDQIASLQKQLDAVSIRRKQMAADAEEQHRRLEEEGGVLDDDEVV
ncbi:hypothetical protein BGZ72_000406 [Mortierella alpina]|nr:hypothetical protein BGZ72_000406 [Mortierella alpina]